MKGFWQFTTPEKAPDRLKKLAVDDLKEKSGAVIRGLKLVLKHHDAKPVVLDALESQLHSYLDVSSSEKVWIEHIKYVLTFPLAKYLRNESPKVPSRGAFKASGVLRKWLKNRLNAFNRKNTHLWYSWLQAKRSALPLSDEMVQVIMDEHLEIMTTEDPCLTSEKSKATADRILRNKDFVSVLDKISENVADEFGRLGDPYRPCSFGFSPSTSACYQATRCEGGASSVLIELVEQKTPSFSELQHSELYSLEILPSLYIEGSGIRHNVVTERRVSRSETEWEELDDIYEERFIKNGLPTDYEFSLLPCKVQVVLEPLKGRVITKGDALEYYMMKPLQKAIHNVMRKMSCFELIGKPFCPTMLPRLARGAERDSQWFSIDYSAATDGLSYYYSGSILQKIVQYLPRKIREIASRVLGLHDLYYPEMGDYSHFYFKGEQRNGQLMGSILSFPVLCLANLGVYLDNTDVIHSESFMDLKSVNERLDRVLINGDDMLYCAPDFLWPSHAEISGDVGLKMSVGKAYVHPIYANVNSCSVHYPLKEGSTPYLVSYLNTGLYFGQNKVMDSGSENTHVYADSHQELPLGSEEDLPKIASVMNVVLDGCLNEKKKKEILKGMLSQHKRAIHVESRVLLYRRHHGKGPGRNEWFHRSLFLPCSIGGMGVRAPCGFKIRLTRTQKNLASYINHRALCDGIVVDTQLPRRAYPLIERPRDIACWLKPADTWYRDAKGKLHVDCSSLLRKDLPSFTKYKRYRGPDFYIGSTCPSVYC